MSGTCDTFHRLSPVSPRFHPPTSLDLRRRAARRITACVVAGCSVEAGLAKGSLKSGEVRVGQREKPPIRKQLRDRKVTKQRSMVSRHSRNGRRNTSERTQVSRSRIRPGATQRSWQRDCSTEWCLEGRERNRVSIRGSTRNHQKRIDASNKRTRKAFGHRVRDATIATSPITSAMEIPGRVLHGMDMEVE